MAIFTCRPTSFSGPGTCIHTLAICTCRHTSFQARLSVYTPWEFALVHIPLVEAQVSVYTPWQIVLVDTNFPAAGRHTLAASMSACAVFTNRLVWFGPYPTATQRPHMAQIFGHRPRPREGPTWPRFWASSTATRGPHVAQILGLVNGHARAPRGPDFGPRQQPREGPTWPRFWASSTATQGPHRYSACRRSVSDRAVFAGR